MKIIAKWLALIPLGILLGFYVGIYFLFFRQSPIKIKKNEDGTNNMYIDFNAWLFWKI